MQNSLKLSKQEAAAELLARREARRGLIGFTEYTYSRYRPADHHRTVAYNLERIEAGEIDRLMLLMPPRHGKSELASRRFPAWCLGRNPALQFISAAASSDFATDFGREVRNTILSQRYRALFSTRLAEDSQAKNKWNTPENGGYYAVGVDGQIMGRGADIFLIDDPFANMADAQSEAGRKRVWDWYQGTVYNRLQPGGRIVVINHRMHEGDLCGKLLEQQAAGGDKWEVVNMPAISPDGDALWPDAYPIEALERIRANTIPRYWSALFQQNPVPDEGDYFKAEWLIPVEKTPPRDSLRVYGGSDYAVTGGGGDFTVHAVLGLDPDGDPWLLDVWRKQASSDEWVESFCDLVIKWKPMGWAEETGQIKSGVGPFLEREMRNRSAYVARETFPTRGGDKAIRAQSFRGLIATRGLRIPKDAKWRADVESEMLRFPAGVHDDVVDACVEEHTCVLMADGTQREIRDVHVGDYVATPIGPCEVIASEETNPSARVYRITTESGRELIATGNHPIFVDGSGFVRADCLRLTDQIVMVPVCSEGHQQPRLPSIAEIGIGDTLTARSKLTETISTRLSQGAAFFTATFGRMSEALSRAGITSTTRTGTRFTTRSVISLASLLRSIARAIALKARLTSGSWNICPEFATAPLHGMEPQKGLHGTLRTAGERGRSESRSNGYVRRAGMSSTPSSLARVFVREVASSAGTAAAVAGEGASLQMVKPSPVNAATDSSSVNGPRSPLTVQKHVECVIAIEALSAPAKVRNLTVNRAHVFYANGFLTHNCGLIGQLLDKMMAGPKQKTPEQRARNDYTDARSHDRGELDPLTL